MGYFCARWQRWLAGFSWTSLIVLTSRPGAWQAAAQICAWARESLPADFAGADVAAEQVRCAKPACPLETVVRVMLAKPKELTISKHLAAVTRDDVTAQLQAWGQTIQRGKAIEAWAREALPHAVGGERLMVDEVETTHVSEAVKYETHIHVLASPPWSMKVLKRIEDVTQKNVQDLMQYAALCGSQGVPSVR